GREGGGCGPTACRAPPRTGGNGPAGRVAPVRLTGILLPAACRAARGEGNSPNEPHLGRRPAAAVAVAPCRAGARESGRGLGGGGRGARWPRGAEMEGRGDFGEHGHDPLLARLQGIIEDRLLERPRISILQSLQDRGVDLLVEWPHRAKYGVQLKSNGDVEKEDFAGHTVMQLADSKQHGLERFFVVIAADIREVRQGRKLDNSNSQKVRGLI